MKKIIGYLTLIYLIWSIFASYRFLTTPEVLANSITIANNLSSATISNSEFIIVHILLIIISLIITYLCLKD